MKTSIINVHDMLSVLSVDEVEKRIGEVPGVESVTVNFAAENATVRYDEAHLEASDIKSAVRQNSYDSGAPDQTEVKPVKDKAEVPATVSSGKTPEEPEAKPVEDKTEAPATAPLVKPSEEKGNTETIPPADEEKVDEHAGHKMDEM